MPDRPTKPERPMWFPESGRPTLDHEAPHTDAEVEDYLEALDLYESKD